MKSLDIDGVEATEDNVESGVYPISRDLYFFTNGDPQGTAYDYISYVLSDAMDQTIRDAGYIPAHKSAATEEGSED